MCDFCSWIKKGNKIYYLTDEIIEAKWGSHLHEEFQQKIGHSAIEEYFGEEVFGGTHIEGIINVPAVIASEINAGNMRRMAEASDPPYRSLRYSKRGTLLSIDGVTFREFAREYRKILAKEREECNAYRPHDTYGINVGDKVIVGKHTLRSMYELRSLNVMKAIWVQKYRSFKSGKLETGTEQKRLNWNEYMERYAGMEATVVKMCGDDVHGFSMCRINVDDGRYVWHCGCLTKV